MKVKNWIIITLILTVLFTVYTFLSINNDLQLRNDFLKEENKNQSKKSNDLKGKFKQTFMNSLYYDNTDLSQKDIQLSKSKSESIAFKSIIGEKNRLVYRISDDVCSICFDQVIEELKKFYDKKDIEDIIILVPLDRMRELKSYFDELKCNIPFYGISKNGLGLGIDQYSPFFFYIDKSMLVKHVFIPAKAEIESTQIYLEVMDERYF
ncbi:hypothetical protein [Confluentibacter sediminis]|uniref:hypothetical protein n=1 Tax=Confluentibacter sediminis TaxID=2219045 RepID=UPI000DAC244B|nr:hypothetical protein [Confluentibacter sediminis]